MDLRVDYEVLGDVAGALNDLADELAGLDDHLGGYGEAVAHEAMVEALEQSGSNWDSDRELIVETMRNAAGYASQAAGLYEETDEGVADGLGEADRG